MTANESCATCPIVCLCEIAGDPVATLDDGTKGRLAEYIANTHRLLDDADRRIALADTVAVDTVKITEQAQTRTEAAVRAMNAYIILSLALIDALASVEPEPVLSHRERIERLRALATQRYEDIMTALGEVDDTSPLAPDEDMSIAAMALDKESA